MEAQLKKYKRWHRRQEFSHNNKQYKVGDTVLINPDLPNSPPFIGKIREVYEDPNDSSNIQLRLNWYYRPEEAVGGRKQFHGEKELFFSDHQDMADKNTIIGRCRVHQLKKYEELNVITAQDYFTRFTYKPGKKEFEPDRVPVYCTCELPYNPDRPMIMCDFCEEWYHPSCIGLPQDVIDKDKNHKPAPFTCFQCQKQGMASHKRPCTTGVSSYVESAAAFPF